MRFIRQLLLLGVAWMCVATQAQEAQVKVISGGTLLDGTGRPAVENAVIVIDGTRIAQVGRRGAIAVPSGATVIDAQGKFVIPGLADMHHHLMSGSLTPIQNPRSVLRRMLAVGVTTVFNPSVSLKSSAAEGGDRGRRVTLRTLFCDRTDRDGQGRFFSGHPSEHRLRKPPRRRRLSSAI